jgi:multimeric flavodoxin WrbA
MNITILNGNPDEGEKFDRYLNNLQTELEKEGNPVTMIPLRDRKLQYCIGCFNCWVKTPGICVHQDDGPGMLTAVINADLVIFASPLLMGFPSALLKKTMDRLIPLIHPHFELVRGEVHHKKRYSEYPVLGMIIEPEGNTDDLEQVNEVFSRFAINFKSELKFSVTTETGIEEVLHEINCA